MKKIVALILSIITVLSFTGCGTPVVVLSFDADKPWGIANTAYEKCVYKIEYLDIKNNKVIGNGEMVYVLQGTEENRNDFVDLSMSFTITFDDIPEADTFRGLTDTITSNVRFTNDALLSSVSSQRTENLAPRKNAGDKYSDADSYKTTADYVTHKAEVLKGKKVDESTGVQETEYKSKKEFPLTNDNTIFDNEQLFYTVRALKSLAPGSTETINVSSPYEISSVIDSKNKYKPIGITVSAASALKVNKLDASFASKYLAPDENNEFPVKCMTVTLTKATKPSGPPITLEITEKAALFESSSTKTNKIIVSIKNVLYDLTNRIPAYNIIYTLTDYTTILK